MSYVLSHKPFRLFLILGGFFVANALVAEFIGGKIFSLEATLGMEPFHWKLLGVEGTLQFSAGVLLWPIVFVMTDVINEYYGRKGVRLLTFMAVGLIGYAFLMIFAAIGLAPADWWRSLNSPHGVPDMQLAFEKVFGQGLIMIIGSLTAFLLSQLLDVLVFHRIKRVTGERLIWLRATGSTVVSQFIDSFVVLYIGFVGGPMLLGNFEPMPLNEFFAIGLVNYSYKFAMAVLLTPLIYLAHYLIDGWLGHEQAAQLRAEAMKH